MKIQTQFKQKFTQKKKRKNAKAFACESKNPFEVEHFHLAF